MYDVKMMVSKLTLSAKSNNFEPQRDPLLSVRFSSMLDISEKKICIKNNDVVEIKPIPHIINLFLMNFS